MFFPKSHFAELVELVCAPQPGGDPAPFGKHRSDHILDTSQGLGSPEINLYAFRLEVTIL